jgi:nicotinamidase-related amidase
VPRTERDRENPGVETALLLVDVVKDFEHEDGERLLASFRDRHPALLAALREARATGLMVVYANDSDEPWDSDAPGLVRRALGGRGGDLVAAVAPLPGETVVLKPRYSAFDATPLASLLEEAGVGRLLLAGTATEMCVFQTAADALRLGLEVEIRADACATVDERHESLALAYLEEVLGVTVSRGPP